MQMKIPEAKSGAPEATELFLQALRAQGMFDRPLQRCFRQAPGDGSGGQFCCELQGLSELTVDLKDDL